MPLAILVNIDVPDLAAAEAFYCSAFALKPGRRLGSDVIELLGWAAPVYLLRQAAGTVGAGQQIRSYARHWTPLHLDIVVLDVETALSHAVAAGAVLEGGVRAEIWGRIATIADPFGHGFCLIEFCNRGYDEIAQPGSQAGE